MSERFISRNRLVCRPQAYPFDTQKGVALVIVLAFVVLLTVLSVAFFSRAAVDRQVSFSSSNQTKADLLARGALAVTVGDLKQELVAGSTISSVSGVTIYSPKTAVPPGSIVPSLVGSTGTNGVENLVKRRSYNNSFYPTNANYDTNNYPASNRAANISSTVSSLNNRSVSTARWNKSF